MTKILALVKSHYLAIICFFVVGAFSIAPQFLAIKSLGSEYRGIPFFYVNDNIYYTAKIQEILDGHGWVSSLYFFEYKNLSSLILPIGEYFYAIPAFVLRLSAAETAVLFNGFLLPAALFFLVYLLTYRITNATDFRGKLNAVAAGLLVILSLDLPGLKIVWAIMSDQYKYATYLSWVRPVNPITGAILLFCFLLLLWALINSSNRRRVYIGIAASVVLSLMVGYFFSWGTAASVWAAFTLLFLLKKDWSVARAIFFVGLLGFILLLPYFFRTFSFISSEGEVVEASYGVSFTHQPVFNKILTLALLIYLSTFFYEYLSKKKIGEKHGGHVWWFCLSLILGGFIALNQQIVTGMTVWYYHFSQYTATLAIVATLVPLYLVFRTKTPKIVLVANFLIILFFLTFGTTVAATYKYGIEGMRELQKYRTLFDWLRDNGEKDCVVLVKESNEERLTILMPAFTQCNVYMTISSGLSSMPLERARHNFMIWLMLNGATAENIEHFLSENVTSLGVQYTKNWKENLSGIHDEKFKELTKQVAAEYRAFLAKDFLTELRKYRIDYLVSEEHLPTTLMKQFGFSRLVGEFGSVYVYQ